MTLYFPLYEKPLILEDTETERVTNQSMIIEACDKVEPSSPIPLSFHGLPIGSISMLSLRSSDLSLAFNLEDIERERERE